MPDGILGTGAITATQDPVPAFKELICGNRPSCFHVVGVHGVL